MRLILSAALAACFCTSALAREIQGPGCFTADVAMSVVKQHERAVFARFDGNEAQALLDEINKIGTQTDFHAKTVIVVLYPDHAGVALFNSCHERDMAVGLEAFSEIWKKVRGVRV